MGNILLIQSTEKKQRRMMWLYLVRYLVFSNFFSYILQSGLPCLSEETILLRVKGVKTYDRNVILEFVSYNVGIIRHACNKRIHTQSY